MIGSFSVEVTNRWEAVALVGLLSEFHSWTVQLGTERWVVLGRADTDAAAALAHGLIAQWGDAHGPRGLRANVGDTATLLSGRAVAQ